MVVWEDGQPLADRETIAWVYECSERTVRRHCTPVRYEQRAGAARGGGTALYDVHAAAAQLGDVTARPARLAALRIYRMPPGRTA